METVKDGFLPALGTPLDNDGNLVVNSFKKQICDQIDAGAVGLLALGSMGQEAFIKSDVYPSVVMFVFCLFLSIIDLQCYIMWAK